MLTQGEEFSAMVMGFKSSLTMQLQTRRRNHTSDGMDILSKPPPNLLCEGISIIPSICSAKANPPRYGYYQ